VFSTEAETIAEALDRYGEPETAEWVLACSDDELVRVCSVVDWLIYNGPTRPSGASMMFAKCAALAAVYVREGKPRDLKRSRRGNPSGVVPASGPRRMVKFRLQVAAPREYAVGEDARRFWGSEN
jgi:hypothetical protein